MGKSDKVLTILCNKCASQKKYDQYSQTTSLQDLAPLQRCKSIVGMKGVKGIRQILVVRNGDDPPPKYGNIPQKEVGSIR